MKCYAFAIGGMPDPIMHPKQAKKVADFLKTLDGMVGIHLYDRWHTLVAFETYNQAVRARNRFKAYGNSVGCHIMHAEISDDNQRIDIGKPADMEVSE